MPIIAADLKFLPAERQTDVLSSVDGQGGGGYAASPVVQSGTSNNVFPDVISADRTTGRRQLRRVFPAVLSNENGQASSVAVAFSARQTDANVEIAAFVPSWPGGSSIIETLRRNAYWAGYMLDTLQFSELLLGTVQLVTTGTLNFNTLAAASGVVPGTDFKVGDKVGITHGVNRVLNWRTITALDTGAGTLTLSGTASLTLPTATNLSLYLQRNTIGSVVAPALTTGAVSAAATDLTVDRLEVRVSPPLWQASTPGYVATNVITDLGGKAPAFRVGARVLVQHPSTPATREIGTIAFVNYVTGVLTLTAGLANAYPVGAIVCQLLEVGDLKASVSVGPFPQQAWTRVWQDTVLGAPIIPRYSGVVGMNNAGGIDERWAIEFTTTTAFRLSGERLGQIAAGNTGSDFLPLNPYTSQPYFTLPAAGWGSGWLPGNVLRFNTRGAHAGVWLSRVVSPSSPGGSDQATLLIRADVDA